MVRKQVPPCEDKFTPKRKIYSLSTHLHADGMSVEVLKFAEHGTSEQIQIKTQAIHELANIIG